jgi:hypothetical protein
MGTFLYVVLLLVLAAGAATDARAGRVEEAQSLAILAALLAVIGPLYRYLIRPWNERASRDRLLEWIVASELDIRHGGALRHGVRVVPQTRLVRFEIVYLLVYLSRRTSKNFHLTGAPRSFLVGLAATLFTAVFGWWALPWGVISTVRALWRNLRGADTTTAEEVLAAPTEDAATVQPA